MKKVMLAVVILGVFLAVASNSFAVPSSQPRTVVITVPPPTPEPVVSNF
jgi:hypothetical protein